MPGTSQPPQPQPGQAPSDLPPQIPTEDAPRAEPTDLPCPHCHYPLAGLNLATVCPECGGDVRDAARAWIALAQAKGRRRGLILFLVSPIIALPPAILTLFLHASDLTFPIYAGICLVCTYVFLRRARTNDRRIWMTVALTPIVSLGYHIVLAGLMYILAFVVMILVSLFDH